LLLSALVSAIWRTTPESSQFSPAIQLVTPQRSGRRAALYERMMTAGGGDARRAPPRRAARYGRHHAADRERAGTVHRAVVMTSTRPLSAAVGSAPYAPYTGVAAVQQVRGDPRRAHIAAAEQFPDHLDIVPAREQVRGQRVQPGSAASAPSHGRVQRGHRLVGGRFRGTSRASRSSSVSSAPSPPRLGRRIEP
jgi:hypothetical protein